MGGTCTQSAVISKPFTWYGWKYPQIKVDSLHFNLIDFVSFQIQSAGVQRHNNKTCHCPNTFGAHCIWAFVCVCGHSAFVCVFSPVCGHPIMRAHLTDVLNFSCWDSRVRLHANADILTSKLPGNSIGQHKYLCLLCHIALLLHFEPPWSPCT